MSKRNVEEDDHQRRSDLPVDDKDDDMGEFEDPYEDEEEIEDLPPIGGMEVDDDEDDDDGTTAAVDDNHDALQEDVQVYLPGQKLMDGETLEHDPSAYDMLHSISVEWPCLSFDLIRDTLGDNRSHFPHTAYAVAGTQADQPGKNKVLMIKLSQLSKTLEEDEDDDNADRDDGSDTEDDPILEHRAVKHQGGVNRIRAMPQQPNICATWADTGRVHLWDLTASRDVLDQNQSGRTQSQEPLFTFSGHPTEGFAMDWSPRVAGRLVTGDCKKHLYLWNQSEGGQWKVDMVPYKGHTDSVEDVQWSPSEDNVFASSSVDQTIRVWDIRKRDGAALSVHAHNSDVNVISWNRLASYLMISGGDDGIFKVWDLRSFKADSPAAVFKWHTAPITSVEWSPHEDSVLAVAGADDQISLWDLSLEADSESVMTRDDGRVEVPPQLLFVHQGQHEIKEVHWHSQIPGFLMSTAESGFNVFKTISV